MLTTGRVQTYGVSVELKNNAEQPLWSFHAHFLKSDFLEAAAAEKLAVTLDVHLGLTNWCGAERLQHLHSHAVQKKKGNYRWKKKKTGFPRDALYSRTQTESCINKTNVASPPVTELQFFPLAHPYAFQLYLRLSKHCSLASIHPCKPHYSLSDQRANNLFENLQKLLFLRMSHRPPGLRLLSFLLLSHQKTPVNSPDTLHRSLSPGLRKTARWRRRAPRKKQKKKFPQSRHCFCCVYPSLVTENIWFSIIVPRTNGVCCTDSIGLGISRLLMIQFDSDPEGWDTINNPVI